VVALRKTENTDGIFMNEFLLLALVIIYLVISYVPISGAPKATWQSDREERSSHGITETGTGTRL
jgi:preprotein translocase subunit SecY